MRRLGMQSGVILTLSALLFAASAPGVHSREALEDPVIHLRVLSNGLRILVHEHHAVPLVAVDLWIRAGSAEEAPNERGAAHFLEHLIFKGTPTRKPGEIDTAFEDLGATLSAGTTRDAAHFYTTVSSAHIANALPVLADAIMHPLLDPIEVERERGVILDELARSSNDVRKAVLDGLFAALFPSSPYESPVLGTSQAIRAVSRTDIRHFYSRWYHPNNATLVFCGDITPDAAEALAKQCFGSWERTNLPALAPVSPAVPTSTSLCRMQGARPEVALGFACPPASDGASSAALAIFARAATVRQANGHPLSGGSSAFVTFIPLRQASLLALDAPLEGQKGLSTLEHWLQDCMENLTDEDVETARRELVGEYLYQTETEGGMAAALGEYDAMGDYGLLNGYVHRLQSVPPSEVRTLVQRTLTKAPSVRVVMEPSTGP